ncbi:MAG: DivIVA domain-containing protein [Selenomonadaceae bacterium]|nr:DivIVA domain-containing protein [Selenomonadaceae bacterium]
MLTPMDIHDHQFKKSFRGYSENEVDDFLDKVVVDFEKLLNETERLKNELYTSKKELEQYRGLEKTMNDTLIVAQRTADEVISNAKKSADDIKEQAARECQQIRDQAHFEAKQHIDAANKKRDAILEDYARLIRERNTFLAKMRTILESELAITNHVISTLPSFEEVDKNPLPENKPAEKPIEKPIKEPPVEVPKPEEKSEDIDNTLEMNLVDVSTKPVAEKSAVNDETKTYKPVKPKLDKEAAK